jgi:tryptophan-rich sensory protein
MASELLRLAPPLVKPVLERTAKNPGVVSRNEHGRSALSAGMIHYRSLLAFLALVLGGGLLIGYATVPGAWYAQLAKPPFNPPDWIFAPVWAALYVLIAIAGSRTRQREPSGVAMGLWWTQLVLNFLWSPIFFAWHRIDLAFIVIALLFAAIVGFIAASWRRDTLAVWLFAPYAAWVAFATLLNGSLFILN